MTTQLQRALAYAEELPARAQNDAARLVMQYIAHVQSDVRLSDEQLAEVRRRRAEKKPKVFTLKQLDVRLRRRGML